MSVRVSKMGPRSGKSHKFQKWSIASELRRRFGNFVTDSLVNSSSYMITVKPVCNDHLYNKTYYLWFIQ